MVIKLCSERAGRLIQETVLIGEDEEHLVIAGTLELTVGEWQTFGCALLLGAGEMAGRLVVRIDQESQDAVLASLDKEPIT